MTKSGYPMGCTVMSRPEAQADFTLQTKSGYPMGCTVMQTEELVNCARFRRGDYDSAQLSFGCSVA